MKRIGYLLGRRVRGDVELGYDSTTGRGGAITAPGARLDGRPAQGILEQSLVPNYILGTRRVEDDRVFRYARAGNESELLPTYAVINGCGFPESAVAAATSLADAYTVTCTAQAAVTLNQFAEGYLVVAAGANKYPFYRIRSNTAQLTPGGTFVVTLWQALMGVITSGVETITLHRNKFAECRSLRQEFLDTIVHPDEEWFAPFVGVPIIGAKVSGGKVAQLAYFWAQTWGPIAMAGFDNFGAVAREQWMVFHLDGSVIAVTHVGATTLQTAGFLLPLCYFGGSSHDLPGAAMFMELQLSP